MGVQPEPTDPRPRPLLGQVSPATNRRFPLATVCEAWRVALSGACPLRDRLGGPLESGRRPTATRPQDAPEGRGGGGEIQTGVAEGESVPRRGPPDGNGAAYGQAILCGQEPFAEADGGTLAADAGAVRPSPPRPDPQRPDPAAAGRVLGRGCIAVLDEDGELVLRGRRFIAPRMSPAGTRRRKATAGWYCSRSASECGPTWAASPFPARALLYHPSPHSGYLELVQPPWLIPRTHGLPFDLPSSHPLQATR